MGRPDVRGVYVGELDTGNISRLTEADAPAVFAPPDHLLYVQQSTLFARRLGLDTMRLSDRPIPLAAGISADPVGGVAALSASARTIAYRTGRSAGRRQFVWVDRGGREISRVGSPEAIGPSYASLSPDGRRLAVQRSVEGNTDQLFEKTLDRAPRRLLLSTPEPKQVTDWSPDGRHVLFRAITLWPTPDIDLWALPLEGNREPFAVVRTPFEERDAQFSPDGDWIAFQSNDSGQYEVYVQPFRRAGERVGISKGGGVQARWRSDGGELFYLTLDGRLVAVPITVRPDGRSLQVGSAEPLFEARVGAVQDIPLHRYIVAPGGQRFLLETVIEDPAPPVSLILNWRAPGG